MMSGALVSCSGMVFCCLRYSYVVETSIRIKVTALIIGVNCTDTPNVLVYSVRNWFRIVRLNDEWARF